MSKFGYAVNKTLDRKFGDNWSVIAWFFECTGSFVDPAAGAFIGECGRGPDVIDAEAVIFFARHRHGSPTTKIHGHRRSFFGIDRQNPIA